MPLTISAAMDRIVVDQAALAITSPVVQTIKKAYKYMPSRASAAPDRPFFMNSWSLVSQDRKPNGWDNPLYVVHMQLCVEDADLDRAADIATAFHEALLVAFDLDITLNDGTAIQDIRGGDPTLAMLEWAGQGFVGLDMFMDLRLVRTRTFAP